MGKDTLGLKNWRQGKGISLHAISAATKIGLRQLEAIESGEFRKLPGGIYDTNYIRQYARAIDFDEARLLAWYRECCATAPPALQPNWSLTWAKT